MSQEWELMGVGSVFVPCTYYRKGPIMLGVSDCSLNELMIDYKYFQVQES